MNAQPSNVFANLPDTPPLPPGPFDLVYADPGLFFQGWSKKGEGRSPQRHYRCEPVDAVCALPVASIMAPNSILAIWVYGPRALDTLKIISAWGCEFTAIGFVWVKINGQGQPLMGLGHTTRKASEIVLLAKCGKGLPRVDAGVLDVVFTPRLKPTGRKPEEVRHRLERLYGDCRRLELYARGETPSGWTFWGDQARPGASPTNVTRPHTIESIGTTDNPPCSRPAPNRTSSASNSNYQTPVSRPR
jgi:N6-adenosine-specific RNA methylase IME4